MRKLLVAGNWKMHLDRAGAVDLAASVERRCADADGAVDVAIYPPAAYLGAVADSLPAGTRMWVGGQDACHESRGAFTGATSVSMMKDLGANTLLVGHSERRHVFGETLDQARAKVALGLDAGLRVVLCVGEKLEEREAGQTDHVVREQLVSAIDGLARSQVTSLTLAYEPVWAIGTGQVATTEQVAKVHAYLRGVIEGMCDGAAAAEMRILYGGSVNDENAREIFSVEDVDGVLVGGASLKAPTFAKIIDAGCALAGAH